MPKSKTSAALKRGSPMISGGKRVKDELIPLPDLNTLIDGPRVFFIGGWSVQGSFASGLSAVSEKVKPLKEENEEPFIVAAKTSQHRSVSVLGEEEEGNSTADKTTVFILPGVKNNTCASEDVNTAMLTHGLHIVGLQPSVSEKNKAAFSARITKSISHNDGLDEDAAPEGQEEESREPKIFVKKPRYEIDTGEEEEEEDGDEYGGEVEKPKIKQYRKAVAVDMNDCVVVHGALVLVGIRPQVTVDPELVTAAKVAVALGISAQAAAPSSGGGKVKRKTDEEKQREAEMTKKLEEESLASAKAESERLSKFAIPERWPTVTISKLAFTGPIVVKRAHIRFVDCHFSQLFAPHSDDTCGGSNTPLVAIHQYCRVDFINCTFIEPQSTGLYAYPTSELYLDSCVFCGYPLPSTAEAAQQLSEISPHDIRSSLNEARSLRLNAVGLHADSAKLTILRCHFEALGSGAVIHGRFRDMKGGDDEGVGDEALPFVPVTKNGEYAYEVTDDGNVVIPHKNPISSVTNTSFISNFGTSLTLDRAARITVKKCTFSEADYYDLHCVGDKCTPQILSSNFGGKINIGVGSHPILYKNKVSVPVINKNEGIPKYMKPTY